MSQQQIMLPDQVTLRLATQDVGNILAALEGGAYKVALPIINSIQAQLLAQQIRGQYNGPLPGVPTPLAPPEVPAELSLVEDARAPTIPNDVLEAISHHPV